jgi:hypothetical protein
MRPDSELEQKQTKSVSEVMAGAPQTYLKPFADTQPIPRRVAHSNVTISRKHPIKKQRDLIFGQLESDLRKTVKKNQLSQPSVERVLSNVPAACS